MLRPASSMASFGSTFGTLIHITDFLFLNGNATQVAVSNSLLLSILFLDFQKSVYEVSALF